MKKIIFLLSVFFLGCSSDNKYLINEGVVNIDYLFNSPNTEWFKKNYDSYNLDTKTLNYDFSNLDEFQIEIYMNTKCHDSEREVPRLIKILNTLIEDPLKELTLEIISKNPIEILKNAGTFEGIPGTGNLSMFYGILLIHANDNLDIKMDSEICLWKNIHIEKININGFWGDYNSKPYLQFQNGYHQYEILDYLGIETIYDASKLIVNLVDDMGRYAPYPGGGSCYDYDAIYMLTRSIPSIHNDLLKKTLSSILLSINADNGFCESQFIRPLNLTNILAIISHVASSNKATFYERTRLSLTLMRPKNNRISTHWSNYSRDWYESNLWDSWFRMLTVARIRVHLGIDPIGEWGFINYPGIGYHTGLKD